PSQMLAQLSHRFDLLASRRRDMAERHRTLRAALDWSYDLLPEELQQFLARLSVFRGGWSLEAAMWIAALPAEDHRWTTEDDRGAPVHRGPRSVGVSQALLDDLEQLREHSLVVAEETALGSPLSALGGSRSSLPPAESGEPRVESRSEATIRFRMLETV